MSGNLSVLRALLNLSRILSLPSHNTILSQVLASGKVGVVHLSICSILNVNHSPVPFNILA
jgi:hypothetical protein